MSAGMVRTAFLLAVCALAAHAQYVYDSTDDWAHSPAGSRWVQNGTSTPGLIFSSGSFISGTPVSGTNPNDYEVKSTLRIYGPGGTYAHFLRAGSTSVQLGSGSYVSVELAVSGSYPASPSTLSINQCVNGAVTQLAAMSMGPTDGMTLRTVVFGQNLWVFVNNTYYMGTNALSPTTGNPGIGGTSQNGGFSITSLGHHDTTAPNPVAARTMASSVFPDSVSFKWPSPGDDPSGIGIFAYAVVRNGVYLANMPIGEFADATVQPATTYTYTFYSQDFHGNPSAATNITVTTPPAGSIDPRHVGLPNTGSYWGGGGEQIDMLSGNMHFSPPLLSPMGRNGWKVPIGIAYDSQNWRQDGAVNWNLGADVGYGYGWKLLIGSITPYYLSWGAVDHYVYTDSTGAEYRLDVNNNGVWSSTHGIYVWFDATANILHFKDGTIWVMGCTSGGNEADAGTMYPTVIEDVSGNQVVVMYDAGGGLPPAQPFFFGNPPYYPAGEYYNSPNSSARILVIEDVRALQTSICCVPPGTSRVSYVFTYDRATYSIPHLTSVASQIGNGESYNFAFAPASLAPPFGTDASFAGLTTVHLTTMTPTGIHLGYAFQYDSAGAGELAQVNLPDGGHLRWAYSTDPYSGGRALRAVTTRYLAADSSGGVEWTYPIARDYAGGATVHASATLTDASANGAKTWNFLNTGAVWQLGLLSEFVQKTSASGTVYTDDTYTWSQDPGGNPYIATKIEATDPASLNPQTAKTTQTLDQYGNVTQSVVYPYNNPTTALRTYTSTYLSSPGYTSNYIRNRLVSTLLTMGEARKNLVQNTYDTNSTTLVSLSPRSSTLPQWEYDPSPAIPLAQRGYLSSSVSLAKTTTIQTGPLGAPVLVTGSDGTSVLPNTTATTNYAAPDSIATATYGESIGYNSWLGVASTTGLNGEQLSMSYDRLGRPLGASSPYGGGSGYSYSDWTTGALPAWQDKIGPDGYTKNTLDGLGRTIRTERGTDAAHLQSAVDTIYAPCACSPLGKVWKVSSPYPSGQSATAWTVYTYDGIGRPVTVTQPDGASTTSYVYVGNQTTVTDPAGKWKRFATDVLGNLTIVVEQDPANQPSGTVTTTYTYDWMNHVSQVSMPRSSTTQTRTFVYSDGGLLLSATNPENGTVTYTYNGDNTLAKKHDAKGVDTLYTYDAARRLTGISYSPADACAAVTFTYDANTVNPDFAHYTQGRLALAQYTVCGFGVKRPVTEMYSYHPAGGVTAKRLATEYCYGAIYGYSSPCGDVYIEADYTYNTVGQIAKYWTAYSGNPNLPYQQPPPIYTYAYDAMGRASTLTDNNLDFNPGAWNNIWGSQYDFAGRVSSMSAVGGRTYNSNGQMTSQGADQYIYPAAQNDGKITQKSNSIETVTYQYDVLKRLTSASAAPVAGSSAAPWTETFQYDGFGNLTGKTLNGTTTAIATDPATNRLVNATYDANGNMLSGAGEGMSYDSANRLAQASPVSGGIYAYGYSPENKPVYRMDLNVRETLTLYGIRGENLATYQLTGALNDTGGGLTAWVNLLRQNVWFAGTMVSDGAAGNLGTAYDRLGSSGRFYPYGEEIAPTPNTGKVKFATYPRDDLSGLDYADQRYYASIVGRFLTPDPYSGSARLGDPGTLNQFSYTAGDPVNRNDPQGLDFLGFALDCSSGYCEEGAPIYCGAGVSWDPACSSFGYQNPADDCSLNPYSAECGYLGPNGLMPSPTNPGSTSGSPSLGTIVHVGITIGICIATDCYNHNPVGGPPITAGSGPADCAGVLAKLAGATATLLGRIAANSGRPDPGHNKAIGQAANNVQKIMSQAAKSCSGVAGAAVAIAAAQAAIDAAGPYLLVGVLF